LAKIGEISDHNIDPWTLKPSKIGGIKEWL
jgi:hypothetical protein